MVILVNRKKTIIIWVISVVLLILFFILTTVRYVFLQDLDNIEKTPLVFMQIIFCIGLSSFAYAIIVDPELIFKKDGFIFVPNYQYHLMKKEWISVNKADIVNFRIGIYWYTIKMKRESHYIKRSIFNRKEYDTKFKSLLNEIYDN